MKLFLILLIIISSYTLVSPSTWFISLVFLGLAFFITFKKYRNDRKFQVFLLIIFVIFTLIKYVSFTTFQQESSFICIVIKRKDSYFIAYDGFEKFYVKSDDATIDIFDIIQIDGKFYEYSGQPVLESGFDFEKYLASRGINRQIFINNLVHKFNFPMNSLEIKNKILDLYQSDVSKTLVKSLLFGDVDYGDSLIKELRNSGSFILISLSGIHINGVYKLINDLLSKFIKKGREKYITYILFLTWFSLNLFNITFLRIFLGKTLRLIIERKNLSLNELETKSIIYLIILLFNKFALEEVSMQIGMSISFLLYFSSTLLRQKRKIFRKLVSACIVFLILIPFNLTLNHSINLINLILNICFSPLIKFIVLIIYPSLFMLKFSFMEFLINKSYGALSFINFHALNINGPPLNQFTTVLYFAMVIIFLYFAEVSNLKCKLSTFYLLSILALTHFIPFEKLNSVEVSFINIGQGDACLLRLKGENILIDTGGSLYHDLATENLIPYFRKNKIYKIDKVYISHYDTDHYYALNSLKKYFMVDKVFDYNNCEEYQSKEIYIRNLNTYDYLFDDENSKSLVLYANIANYSFLFMGDAPKTIEKAIIDNYPSLDVDYLKVGHHGSKTSSLDEFIKTITPKEAIISCGKNNSYGHPDKETINVLNRYNVTIRRTDLEGTIKYKFFL